VGTNTRIGRTAS